MLMHGCKEGQCAACKSFVLEGEDIELDKYSTFALPDFEKEEGYTLLCRAHVYEDVTIELLNYDEEMIRSGHPIQQARRRGGVERRRSRTTCATWCCKLIEPTEIPFFPGQYVDITDPGHRRGALVLDGQHLEQGRAASSSSSSRSTRTGCSPSSSTSGDRSGDRLELTGPYGVFTLRDGRDCDLVFVGGGAGMAPILSRAALAGRARQHPQGGLLLRRRAATRSVLRGRTARARADDAELPLRPGAVGTERGRGLGRRGRPDHRRGQEVRERPVARPTAYVCGPPPMVEAAMQVLTALGATEKRIYYDKFTTTGSTLSEEHDR